MEGSTLPAVTLHHTHTYETSIARNTHLGPVRVQGHHSFGVRKGLGSLPHAQVSSGPVGVVHVVRGVDLNSLGKRAEGGEEEEIEKKKKEVNPALEGRRAGGSIPACKPRWPHRTAALGGTRFLQPSTDRLFLTWFRLRKFWEKENKQMRRKQSLPAAFIS